jgi:hypothetical protein
LLAWKKFLQTIGQKFAKDYRYTEGRLQSALQTAENDVQSDPSNPILLNQMFAVKDTLRKHQKTKIQGAKVRSRVNWFQQGDWGSKFFFNLLKHKQIKESIDKLVIDNKEMFDPSSIGVAFADYYSKLFASEDSKEADALRSQCRSLIPIKLDFNDITSLAKPISIEEIKDAIRALKDDKALGPDGLSIKFYKVNID